MRVTEQLTRLSAASERRIRRTATGFVVFVALAAAILSFSGLHDLALNAGFHPYIAPLFPLATDVAVAAFSLAVLHHSLTGLRVWYPWLCMLLGVGVSVAGNVWAAPDDLVSRLVHAWPPIVFALAFEALTRLIRHRIDHPRDLSQGTPVQAGSATTQPAQVQTSESLPLSQPLWTPTAAPPRVAPTSADELPPSHPVGRAPRSGASTTDSSPTKGTTEDPRPVSTPSGAHSAASIPTAVTPQRARQSPARTATLRDRIVELVEANPSITQAEVARTLASDPSNISKVFKKLRVDRPELFTSMTGETDGR